MYVYYLTVTDQFEKLLNFWPDNKGSFLIERLWQRTHDPGFDPQEEIILAVTMCLMDVGRITS